MITDPLALAAVVTGVTGVGFWLEGRFAWARRVGASLLIIALGAVLSNLEVVPLTSGVYDVVGGPVTSLAIVWLLLAVDLRDLREAGPRMLMAFGVAGVATCLGALTASVLLHGALPGETWRLAGVMTGTYIGGSINFVAVGRAVELPESIFAAATAADNVLTAVWMGATLMLPVWLGRFFPRRAAGAETSGEEAPEASHRAFGRVVLEPVDLLALLTLGLGLILVAQGLADTVGGPAVVWLTTLALVAGQVRVVRSLTGAFQLGLIALNLFFAVIGIGSRLAEIFRVGPEVFYFTAVVVAVHGVFTYGVGRLLRLDVETVSVASQAAVGGPSTAMALAAARGWRELALPGVVAGLLGYAVGNYAGLLIAAFVRSWG